MPAMGRKKKHSSWAQGLNYNNVAKRNVIRTQTHSALGYSTNASKGGKCPICLGDHMFVSLSGETSFGSRITECTDGFMKRSSVACIANSLAQSWMEVLCAERSTTVVYTGQTLVTSSQCPSTYRQKESSAAREGQSG